MQHVCTTCRFMPVCMHARIVEPFVQLALFMQLLQPVRPRSNARALEAPDGKASPPCLLRSVVKVRVSDMPRLPAGSGRPPVLRRSGGAACCDA